MEFCQTPVLGLGLGVEQVQQQQQQEPSPKFWDKERHNMSEIWHTDFPLKMKMS